MENTALNYFLAQPGQAGAEARAAYNANVRSEMGWDGPRDAGDPMAAFNAQRGKFAGSLGGFMDNLAGMGERIADRAVAEKYAGDQSAPVQAARRQARTAAGEKAAAEGRVVTTRDIEREFAGVMRRSDPEAEKLWTGVKAAGGFGNTAQALGALPDRFAAGFAPATGRLSRNARGADLRAQGVGISEKAKEYDDKAVARMSALRQVGWQKVTRDDRGRVVRDPMTGKLVKFETERGGNQAAAARREYHTVAQQRRQTGAAYQTAYRDTVSERLGLTGERKERYWSLVDRSREEYRQYYRRYQDRVQAGDTAGAAGVRREWSGRLQAYRRESGNLVKDAPKTTAAPVSGDQARAEKSLGDMAALLAQQKLLQVDLLKAMQGVDATLKLVMGV